MIELPGLKYACIHAYDLYDVILSFCQWRVNVMARNDRPNKPMTKCDGFLHH